MEEAVKKREKKVGVSLSARLKHAGSMLYYWLELDRCLLLLV
jgi:hypothetical protein